MITAQRFIAGKSKPVWKFPCLGIAHNGHVVLFTSQGVGTVVIHDETQRIGYHSEDFIMSNFTPLEPKDSVTLRNSE